MPLTTDDFISMHKATERVINDVKLFKRSKQDVARGSSRWYNELDAAMDGVVAGLEALAVVQRDLLKDVVETLAARAEAVERYRQEQPPIEVKMPPRGAH